MKEESLSRLQPKTGTVCAVTQVRDEIYYLLEVSIRIYSKWYQQVASGEQSDIENAETDPEARINYSSISRDR